MKYTCIASITSLDPMIWSTAETSNPDMECVEEEETKVCFSGLDEELSCG